MPFRSLQWFRVKQRSIARFVLAAFCLTWLQLAAMPCVMATGAALAGPVFTAAAGTPDSVSHSMPAGMKTVPGEHCMYCPPAASPGGADVTQALCTFPHDLQVDLRAAFAAATLAPPPVVVHWLPPAAIHDAQLVDQANAAPPPPHPTFAVSYCRFLK